MRRVATFAALVVLALGGGIAGFLLRPQGTARAAHPRHVSPKAQRAQAERSQALRALRHRLRRRWSGASDASGAFVVDLDTGQEVFGSLGGTPRAPASVEKLYTTSTALLRYGANARLTTRVAGAGHLSHKGVWQGDLYLIGGGDPTYGWRSFVRHRYGTSPATAQRLARRLERAGIRRVHGRIVGDESAWDSLRGGPSSGGLASYYVGPLSALDADRGLFSNGAFQPDPPLYAAKQLVRALRHRHIAVTRKSRTGTAPAGAHDLAHVRSPRMARLVALTNPDSDNYMAEMLVKGIGAHFGAAGSTAAGAQVVHDTVSALAHIDPHMVDGSGLSRQDQTTPRDVVALLGKMWPEAQGSSVPADAATALFESLPVAGRTGTLEHRMNGTAADGRCHAKTGTLTGVSALAGYCISRAGDTFAFAFLMNDTDIMAAHRVQDREAEALAGYRG